jgi:hypothetical protein
MIDIVRHPFALVIGIYQEQYSENKTWKTQYWKEHTDLGGWIKKDT